MSFNEKFNEIMEAFKYPKISKLGRFIAEMTDINAPERFVNISLGRWKIDILTNEIDIITSISSIEASPQNYWGFVVVRQDMKDTEYDDEIQTVYRLFALSDDIWEISDKDFNSVEEIENLIADQFDILFKGNDLRSKIKFSKWQHIGHVNDSVFTIGKNNEDINIAILD